MSELHGLEGCKQVGVFNNAPPTLVAYPLWTTFALGGDPQGGYPEAGEMGNLCEREDNPLALANHIYKFVVQKGQVWEAELMGSLVDGSTNLL